MNECIQTKYMIYTYWENQRYYLLKDGTLAPLNKFPFKKYKSYKNKKDGVNFARQKTRDCGYKQQFSIIQVYFK